MAKMTTAQIMEKVAGILSELNSEGVKVAQYNLNAYTKNPKSITAQEAKELYFDLIQNYLVEDEVEWEEEDTVDMELPSAMENSIKKTTNKKDTKSKEEKAAEQLVNIIDKKPQKESKLKSNKNNANKDKVVSIATNKQSNQQEVVYDQPPTPEQIVELVGYRYAFPKFPMEFNCKALNNRRLINREDIQTIKEFKAIEGDLYTKNGQEDNFVIAVYVKEEEIVDSRMYDYLNIYPNKSFGQMFKDRKFNIEHFPQELDILKIVHISDLYIVAESYFTGIPYIFTHNRFKNNDKLHCRANFMGLDFQIYQVQY